MKKKSDKGESAVAPRVGGVKGKKKAAAKASAKGKGKKGASQEVKTRVEEIAGYTPSRGKKETPQKGKASARKTISVKKRTPAMPSPGGAKTNPTTDKMTMAQFKNYLDWHEKQKKTGKSSQGKVLGKRSAASGKSTAKGGKKSKK